MKTRKESVSHTPTPWKLKLGYSMPGQPQYFLAVRADAKDTASMSMKKADAELIVNAVNSHQDLIDALGSVLALLEDGSTPTESELRMFKARLAKADGK